MKSLKFSITTIPFLLCLFFISCKKEIQTTSQEEVQTTPLQKAHVSGFADNDMVMYWNEKAATVFNPGFSQPARSRVFARVQVAVHDALIVFIFLPDIKVDF